MKHHIGQIYFYVFEESVDVRIKEQYINIHRYMNYLQHYIYIYIYMYV